MPTSVHIPQPLLDAVDRKARALHVSRNRLIVAALQREIEQASDWPVGLFDALSPLDEATSRLLDDSLDAVREKRRSKNPVDL